MVKPEKETLLEAFAGWIQAEPRVKAAVLFGSQVRKAGVAAAADAWSDIDLHLINSAPEKMGKIDWAQVLPGLHFCHQAVRPATGGVRKVTVFFAEGEADLVLVPALSFRLAGWAMVVGLEARLTFLRTALDSLATILSGGYRCLKGERQWGWIYARVLRQRPGFRIDDAGVRQLADVFLCDLVWVLQKLERGELVAAQRILHRALLETNVLLVHEVRTRHALPTFQQARRVEQLVTPAELAALQVNTQLNAAELRAAAWELFAGCKMLIGQLVPDWTVPPGMQALLERYKP